MTRRRSQQRSGAILVVAIVCLLITLSIVTTMVTATIARRVQLQAERNARQAELLVVAGRGRAAARLAADAEYQGESWTPSLDAAAVEITLQRDGDAARVTVVATYPEGDPHAVRRSRVFTFPQAEPQPEE